MNNYYFLLIPIFTLFGSLGSYFLKKTSRTRFSLPSFFFDRNVYTGCFFYFISAIINIKLLQELPYIVVLPCSALTYVWTFLISFILLKEKIGFMKEIGILLILIGVTCLALGGLPEV